MPWIQTSEPQTRRWWDQAVTNTPILQYAMGGVVAGRAHFAGWWDQAAQQVKSMTLLGWWDSAAQLIRKVKED